MDLGYIFANWSEGIGVVSTSSSNGFTADFGRSLVANFSLDIPQIGGDASGGWHRDSRLGATGRGQDSVEMP